MRTLSTTATPAMSEMRTDASGQVSAAVISISVSFQIERW
jgi:hypothetical protein